MTKDRFALLLSKMEDTEHNIVLTKGEEYTHGNADRLASFKEAGAFTNMLPRQVCMVYLTKHFQALADYVKSGKSKSEEGIAGRITDLRVYLSLMQAIIVDDEERIERERVEP